MPRKIIYQARNNEKGVAYFINFWEWEDGRKAIFIEKEIQKLGDNAFKEIARIDDMNKKYEIYKALVEKVFSSINADDFIFLLGTKYVSAKLTIDEFKKAVLYTLDMF